MSALLVELLHLIVCLENLECRSPSPILMHPPVCPHMFLWHACEASMKIFMFVNEFMDKILFLFRVPYIYWRTLFNFFPSSLLGYFTLVHKSPLLTYRSSLARFATWSNFCTMLWNISVFRLHRGVEYLFTFLVFWLLAFLLLSIFFQGNH